jgi:hypothetical protein
MPVLRAAALLLALLAGRVECLQPGGAGTPFQPQPIRGTLAQVWTIPSGCPSNNVTPAHQKGATFWADDTLWAAYLRSRDADAQLLKHSLGDSPNATAIVGFELYLSDTATWGPQPMQRLGLALAHFRAHGVRPLLFLLDVEFYGRGTWATTHDIVHDPQARAYVLRAVRTVLGAERVAESVEFVSTYWIGQSAHCTGATSVCTEAEIGELIGDLQSAANSGGATYLQHVDGPYWNAPGQNVSGYSAVSLARAQGVMAESWTMGTLLKGVGALLVAGGATRDSLLLLNDVPNCDLHPATACSTGSVEGDTETWYGWLDELGLSDTWGVWDFVDGGGNDPNAYGDVTNDGSALTTKGKLHRERALNSTLEVAAAAAGRSWFLRPSGERETADGKSFDTAWAKVRRVQWEAIKPGDTLFVCGLGSGPFVLPAGFSGAEGADVTIDGSCPRPDGSVDQALWIGGDLIGAPFPAGWSGPDAAGIYSSAYAGDAAYGLAVAPNASDMAHLARLRRGACDASGPTNVSSSWPADTFCEGPRTYSPAKVRGPATVYYKPGSASRPARIFGSLLGVLITTNNSDLVIANMRVAFGARLLDVNGGARVTLRNNTLKWASQNGISFNSKAGHPGPHPGTQGALVTRNRISECACGLYIINQNDSAKFGNFPNYMNSNDLVISHNNFTSIDPINFYHNKDTHAIGIQGGSRCVYEHNIIDGAGGSGITFYQGPGQLMEDNVARLNTILNIRDAEGKKNQRGIEFCDDNRAGNRSDSNNSFYYNVLANITGVAIRSKALRPAAARGGPGPLAKCGWRFLNNVVLDAGIGFELQAMAGNPDPQGTCAVNNIFACGLGAQPCDPGYRHQVGVPANATTISNNLYFPDRDTYFCASGKEGATSGCTAFAEWAKMHSNNAGTESVVADPQFADASRWPDGLRPTAGSAAAAHGRPVGLSTDFAGVPVPSGKPDIGAFQISAKTDGHFSQLPALPSMKTDAIIDARRARAAVAAAAGFATVEHDTTTGTWWFQRAGRRFITQGVSNLNDGGGDDGVGDVLGMECRQQQHSSLCGDTNNWDMQLNFSPYFNVTQRLFNNSAAAWAMDAASRLQGWSFNTISGYSSSVAEKAVAARGMFYNRLLMFATRFAMPNGSMLQQSSAGGCFAADVFSSEFARSADQYARDNVAPRANDTALLGFHFEKEVSWNRMDLRYWLNPEVFAVGTPGRTAAIKFVTAQYNGDIEQLNKAYNCSIASFTDLSECVSPASHRYACQREGSSWPEWLREDSVTADSSAFILVFARRYFDTVTRAIRKYDNNHLLFGMRGGCFGSHSMLSLFKDYIDVYDIHKVRDATRTLCQRFNASSRRAWTPISHGCRCVACSTTMISACRVCSRSTRPSIIKLDCPSYMESSRTPPWIPVCPIFVVLEVARHPRTASRTIRSSFSGTGQLRLGYKSPRYPKFRM